MFLYKSIIEAQAFGVCTRLGQKMGLSTKRIRLFFLYTSFLTLGSPIIIYMVLAFWMNMRQYAREKRTAVWDL
jgi:phage shock protein C